MTRDGQRFSWGVSLLLHGMIVLLFVLHLDFFQGRRFVIEQGKEDQQQVIEASLVSEKIPEKRIVTAATTPASAKPNAEPKPVLIARPLASKKQLLADLQKDMAHQKHQQSVQRQKILNAKALQKQLLQEKIRAEGVRMARMRGEVDRYRALILQVISQNWRVPGGFDKNRFAELLIRLAPGGTVLDVQITRSSGNAGLDGSARSAVFRSSPLPVPKESAAFEPFRSFLLKVKPEDILATNA